MRINHTTPAGAGRVQHATLTDKLLKVIDNLGNDKYGNPVGIRSTELAAASGVPAKSITALLATAVTKGRVVVCKITIPGSHEQNEYRKGGGLPPPEFRPLNTRRAGIALRGTPKPPSAPPTPLSTPTPAAATIQTPIFLNPTQPEVVAPSAETSAAGGVPNPPAAEPAVAAQATPRPTAGAALKKEPATPKASAGDVRIGINDAGTLVIAIDDDSIELNPKNAKRLGHFMAGTAGIWNLF